MQLPDISSEQNEIIQQLRQNNNIVVDSVAGSGKTTCNLHIAKHFSDMNILLLTYNSKLKIETREKAKKLGIFNIEVHSYHSFCVKYYDQGCFRDEPIKKMIKKKKNPLKKIYFDIIVPDEAQDITSLYYELICKIYKDNENKNAKICIFGDKNQCIFDFNKADQRFIEYASDLFNFNSKDWVKCNLSVSFRITYEMSLFINKCMINKERIQSNKISNHKPRYIICDTFGEKPFEEVKYYLSLGYKPDDIFILAPSLKSVNAPVRQVENKIKRDMPDVMVYVPSSDDEKLDGELLQGKIVFSTFHQTKGLERKIVIIFSFDGSFFKFFKKNANPCVCPNELYVATTRAMERLTLFHHCTNEYLQFIDKVNLQQYCDCDFDDFHFTESENKSQKKIDTPVTGIIKFLSADIVDHCFEQLETSQCSRYLTKKINIPLKISNETTESVSDITGIAIPSMFELKLKNKMEILDLLVNANFENTINRNTNKKYNLNDINISTLRPDELLYISNCWNAYKSGYLFKVYQITSYEWLEGDKLDDCINRLSELDISINSSFEYKLEIEHEIELLNRKLIGYIDCVDEENNVVYEFKCVQRIEKEHYLQLALYMYMFEVAKRRKIKIITDEFDKTLNKSMTDLLYIKEHIIEKTLINEKKLIDCETNIVFETEPQNYTLIPKLYYDGSLPLNEFVSYLQKPQPPPKCYVGNIIKYYCSLSNQEKVGEIVKIYKTTGNIKIKNGNNKNIDIPKTQILSVKMTLDADTKLRKIAEIKNELLNLHNESTINNLLDEEKQTELMTLKHKFDHDIKTKYEKQTEYVLFNIITNEHINVKCEFEKLKNMVEYLIFSKYINCTDITDEEFIKLNKDINKVYFGENVNP